MSARYQLVRFGNDSYGVLDTKLDAVVSTAKGKIHIDNQEEVRTHCQHTLEKANELLGVFNNLDRDVNYVTVQPEAEIKEVKAKKVKEQAAYDARNQGVKA